jgi:hypothetical protein
MSGKSRWDYLKAIYFRYKKVSKPLRARILDESCQVCGYNRKYAIRLLGGPAPQKPKNRGHVYGFLNLPSSSLNDFACDAVGRPLTLLLPTGTDQQTAAGRGTIHRHRPRRRRRCRSHLIRALSICAGLLDPVHMRSKGSSVQRHCESPNEVMSPPGKNVPMMLPRVIGRSRCDGCDSSWAIVMRSGRRRRKRLRAKLRINASIALPGLPKYPNLNSQFTTESDYKLC